MARSKSCGCFYICVYLKDLAGNSATILSQPMIGLWRVLAGDNNQGNGGSVNATNVRFKAPYLLARDSKKNTYIYDRHFNTIRRVSATNQITLVAGNGQQLDASLTEHSQNSPLPLITNMTVDSQDRLIVGMYQRGVFVLNPFAEKPVWKKILSNACAFKFSLSKKTAGDILYIQQACTFTPNTLTAVAYLYKIPLATIEATANANLGNFVANRIAGSGTITYTSETIPADIELGPNDPADAQHSLDYPTFLYAFDNGDLFLSTTYESTLRGYGHAYNRYMKLLPSGKYRTVIVGSIGFVSDTTAIPVNDGGKNLLHVYLGHSDTKMAKMVIDPSIPKVISQGYFSFPSEAGLVVGPFDFTYRLRPCLAPLGAKEFVVASSAESRLVRLSGDMKTTTAMWGRPVFSAADTVATEAMVANPSGLDQDSQGNTYIFDRYNQIIRKVDPQGKISTYLGQPTVAKYQYFNNTPFSTVTFNGLENSGESHPLIIHQEGGKDVMYLSDLQCWGANAGLHRFDMVAQKADTVLRRPARAFNAIGSWCINDIVGNPDGTLGASRYYPLNRPEFNEAQTGIATSIAGTAESLIVGSIKVPQTPLSSPMPAASTEFINMASSITDRATIGGQEKDMMFVNGTSKDGRWYIGLVDLASTNKTFSIVQTGRNLGAAAMRIIAEGTKRHLFMINSQSIRYAQFDVSMYSSTAPTLNLQQLCLPGTFLNGTRYLSLSKAGNLIVSDTNNGRVLEYFVKNTSGGVSVIPVGSSSCLQ